MSDYPNRQSRTPESDQMDIFTFQEQQTRRDSPRRDSPRLRIHHTRPVKRSKQLGPIRQRFERFRQANPHVSQELANLALELKRAGVEYLGIKALFETLRYQRALRTAGEKFKLNNNYTAHYARLLMQSYPELDGFFELRRSVADA